MLAGKNSYVTNSSLEHGKCHCVGCSNATGSCISLKSFCRGPTSPKSFPWRRYLSSQARAKSSDLEDDIEDGFSDLDEPPESAEAGDGSDKENDEDLMSEAETSGEAEENAVHSLEFSDAEPKLSKVKGKRSQSSRSPLFKIIMGAPRHALTTALDKYVEEGKPFGRGEISLAMLNLRKHRLYSTALQVTIICILGCLKF